VNHCGVGRESIEGQVGEYCWEYSGEQRRRRKIVTRDAGRVTGKVVTRDAGRVTEEVVTRDA